MIFMPRPFIPRPNYTEKFILRPSCTANANFTKLMEYILGVIYCPDQCAGGCCINLFKIGCLPPMTICVPDWSLLCSIHNELKLYFVPSGTVVLNNVLVVLPAVWIFIQWLHILCKVISCKKYKE